MRAGVVMLTSLVACSPGGQPSPAPTQTASASAAGADVPTQTVQGPATGRLRGEVSPLSGVISDFKVTVSDTETIVELPADILFAFDSAGLASTAQSPLQRTADLIAKGSPGNIRIVGHTDAKGEPAYNMALSQRRAQAVSKWLIEHGVPATRLKPAGHGETEPVAPDEGADGADNPQGRALNRRVVVYIPRSMTK